MEVELEINTYASMTTSTLGEACWRCWGFGHATKQCPSSRVQRPIANAILALQTIQKEREKWKRDYPGWKRGNQRGNRGRGGRSVCGRDKNDKPAPPKPSSTRSTQLRETEEAPIDYMSGASPAHTDFDLFVVDALSAAPTDM